MIDIVSDNWFRQGRREFPVPVNLIFLKDSGKGVLYWRIRYETDYVGSAGGR